ncbi:aldehyde dehydrogenase family protein [Sinorhizobium alkalisoli]|uniref:aldehyde dehydrogenase family protein n=1 Tax=Sinorhizobium alkalisoli TaxID=1752398 RepID=UPI000A60E5E9|nr:aldehyde dehydrogenase family protein [Sinorhizobium alkalisoli]
MMITERGNQFYIGGEWQEHTDATSLPVVDPASERVIGHIAAGEANHVDLAVAAARKAFPAFSQSSVPERLELLGRVYALLNERAELFAEALVMEMGAAISFARASQVPFAAEHIRVQMEVLENYRFVTVDGRTATA